MIRQSRRGPIHRPRAYPYRRRTPPHRPLPRRRPLRRPLTRTRTTPSGRGRARPRTPDSSARRRLSPPRTRCSTPRLAPASADRHREIRHPLGPSNARVRRVRAPTGLHASTALHAPTDLRRPAAASPRRRRPTHHSLANPLRSRNRHPDSRHDHVANRLLAASRLLAAYLLLAANRLCRTAASSSPSDARSRHHPDRHPGHARGSHSAGSTSSRRRYGSHTRYRPPSPNRDDRHPRSIDPPRPPSTPDAIRETYDVHRIC